MLVDFSSLSARQIYQWMIGAITPRPIAWVSTISPNGISNLAPFSFFSGVSAVPPTLVFSPVNRRDGSKKDTVINIESTPEFVVNMVSQSLAEAMSLSSGEFPYEESEFEKCGLTPAPSLKIKPPRVKEAKIQFECTLHQIVRVGEGPLAANLVIGKILLMHIDDQVIGADGLLDPRRLDTIGRMGGESYVRTSDLFEIKQRS